MKKLALYAFLLCVPFIGFSQTDSNQQSNDWQFNISPYAWLVGTQGDMSLNNSGELDPVFSDTMDPITVTGGVAFAMKKGNWGILFDAFYAGIKKDGTLNAPYPELGLTDSVEGDFKHTSISLGGSYVFAQAENFTLNVLFGGRYFNASSKIIGGDLVYALYDDNNSFIEPYVGLGFNNNWNKVNIAGSVDAGGFGIGSEISYNYNLLVGYQITDLLKLDLGYKAYKPLYKDDNFSYNLSTEGFFLGLNFAL